MPEIHDEHTKRLFRVGFLIIFSASLLAHWLLFIREPTGVQSHVYFGGMGDFEADFFNLLRYIANRDPYYIIESGDAERAYLPICYLLLYPFSRLENYADMGLGEIWDSHRAMMSLLLFLGVSVGLFVHSLILLCRRYRISDVWVLPLFFSGIMFFSLERGNLIFISVAMTAYFLNYYDSERPEERGFAAFALALAAAIKVYPLLFGVLYLKGKKTMWREVFLSAGLALVLVFLPFLFFEGGLSRLPQLLTNVQLNSLSYGNVGNPNTRFGAGYLVFAYLTRLHGMAAETAAPIAVAVGKAVVLLAAAAVVLAIFCREYTGRLALISFAVLFLPENSQLYCGLYLFPLFLAVIGSTEKRPVGVDLLWLIIALIALMPLCYIFYPSGFAVDNWIVLDILLMLTFVIVVIYCAIGIVRDMRRGVGTRT